MRSGTTTNNKNHRKTFYYEIGYLFQQSCYICSASYIDAGITGFRKTKETKPITVLYTINGFRLPNVKETFLYFLMWLATGKGKAVFFLPTNIIKIQKL